MSTPIPTTTSIANWNRATKHVESAVRSGRYINAETSLIFAGPPRITDIGGINSNQTPSSQNGVLATAGTAGRDALYPIGIVEQFGIQQAQTVQKMFEIGSRRSYQAAGRVQVMGSLGRVVINGPSLLRVCYAYYPNTIALANGKTMQANDSVSSAALPSGSDTNIIFPQIYFEPGSFAGQDPESTKPHTFFMNLMSDLFANPFGIGVIFRDGRNVNYGAFYLEDCFITTHSLQISSSSTLVTEAINFQADAAVPMEFSTASGLKIATTFNQ